MVDIVIDDSALTQKLSHVAGLLKDPTPLMQRLSLTLLEETEQNFAAQGRPAWAGLNPKYKARKKGTSILQESGQLAASITPFHGRDHAGVSTNKEYAAIHQFGGTIKHGGGTRYQHNPGSQLAKFVKNSFTGPTTGTTGAHDINIPARPFMPMDKDGNLQRQAVPAIEEIIDLYLKKAFI